MVSLRGFELKVLIEFTDPRKELEMCDRLICLLELPI